MIECTILKQEQLHLIGMSLRMSHINNRTVELWRSFMPRRREITATDSYLYSLRVYDRIDHPFHDPSAEFVKWACVKTDEGHEIPEGMQQIVVSGGLYAVFPYKGLPSAAASIFRAIFTEWLPKSEYQLDLRPHFELLGEKYDNNSPDSEEDIYLPIRPR